MDQLLFPAINGRWISPALDWGMALPSDFSFWGPVLALGLLAVLVFGGAKARVAAAALILAVLVTDAAVVNGLKHWVNRPRPSQAAAVRVVKSADTRPRLLTVFRAPRVTVSVPEKEPIAGRSFPSGHTSDNFAAAAVLALFYRRRGWLYALAAAAVGYSRIYTGAHWPSDVLFSVFLGSAMGVGVTFALRALWRRYGGRMAPRFFEKWGPDLLSIPTQ